MLWKTYFRQPSYLTGAALWMFMGFDGLSFIDFMDYSHIDFMDYGGNCF